MKSCLYPIFFRQRITEDAEIGRREGDYKEEKRERHQCRKSELSPISPHPCVAKQAVFVKIGAGGGDEENGNIHPIGRFADDPVVGVEKDRNECKPKQNAAQLHAPKIAAVAEEKPLHARKEKHRQKEQLHMLPSRLIHPRKGRNPLRLAKPLVKKMQEAYEKSKLDRIDFESLQEQVIYKLSAQGSVEYLHSISNLALLNTSDNAALSNAMFDVKRNVIIEMDKKGQYIPFCTKMVFLKYYTESKDNQVHFWGAADRIAYVKGINRVLAPYLQENITVEKEEKNE